MAEDQNTTEQQQAEAPKGQVEASPEAPADKAQAEAPQAAETKAPEPAVEPSRQAPPVPEGEHYFWGTGRRKRAIARVRMRPGEGKILINKKAVDEYFRQEKDRQLIMAPLQMVNMVKSWDIWANVSGGGYTGQAGAVTLGIARAIAKAVPELEPSLRDNGLLTRDSRMRERKKYGQKGARKRFQFSKR